MIDRRSTALLGFLCVVASLGLSSSAALDIRLREITAERLNQAEKEAGNWLTYGGTYRAWRYNPLDQVNASNVHRLRAAWAFQLGELDGGSPITYAVGGKQYVATPSGWGGLAARALAAYWPETAQLTSGATIFAFTLPESDTATKKLR